jgi:hypothetical protein
MPKKTGKRRPPVLPFKDERDAVVEQMYSNIVTRLLREEEKPEEYGTFFIGSRRMGAAAAYLFKLSKAALKREAEHLAALPEKLRGGRRCLRCAKLFAARRKDQQFCSTTCRQAHYRHSPKGKAQRRKDRQKLREREEGKATSESSSESGFALSKVTVVIFDSGTNPVAAGRIFAEKKG